MGRAFSSGDAKRVLAVHGENLNKLHYINELSEGYRAEVKNSVDSYITTKAMQTLANISVDELNRDKQGIRVKLLHDNGYNTIADLANVPILQFEMINGISFDGAQTIRKAVDAMIAQVKSGTKLSLSTDNKTAETTRIVRALAMYRIVMPVSKKSGQLLVTYENRVNQARANIAPATSGFKWFFTSKANKQNAESAYNLLSSLIGTEYGTFADKNLSIAQYANQISDNDAWADFENHSINFYNLLEDIAPGVLGNDNSVYGLPEGLAGKIQSEGFNPEGLKCELRKYQETGVKYALHQKKVLLGDEMGLGKTIQAIAVMVSLRNGGATHFMVVCPASVIANWCREIAAKSDLSVVKIHGHDKNSALESWLANGGVAVTTYETTGFIDLADNFRFSTLIVDEAHYIKNPEARRTGNVRNIADHAERMLFMTGTALENKVDEMIELIKVLQPLVADDIKGMEYLSSAPQFREKVAPVYFRRKREDVLTELPELIEKKEWCELGSEEKSAYDDAVLNRNYAKARRVSWNIDDMSKSSKAQRLLELVDKAAEDGRKVIVFSFFLDTIAKVTALLGDRCVSPINGSVSPQRRQEIIDEFDKAQAGKVLPAQIQSGGTGLNIQSASVIILCEPQFKPSVENQAISRAYRMGQTRNVLVYRLLCEDTVDEKILKILGSKQNIFDAFADKSVAAENSTEAVEIDDTGFANIMDEEAKRITAEQEKVDTTQQ